MKIFALKKKAFNFARTVNSFRLLISRGKRKLVNTTPFILQPIKSV